MIRSFVASLLCAMPLLADAALPPRSADDLRQTADTIVVGVVEALAKLDEPRERDFANTNYTLGIRVESAEKGEPDAFLLARGWVILARPQGWAGPAGVHALPSLQRGQHLRLFLKATGTGDYEILQPNGIEPLQLPFAQP